MSLSTKEIVRNIISLHEREPGSYLSKSLAILSHRPFNMKGQEIEEIVGLMIHSGLQKYYNITSPVVSVPQNKKAADVLFDFNGTKRELDIKSYGGAERFQLSTLKLILQSIRDEFQHDVPGILSPSKKNWLIDKIDEVQPGYTLSFLSFIRNTGAIDIHGFDFESLSLRPFESLDFELRKTGKEQRVELFIQITNNSTLEISAGGNPYNRGMWINGIRGNEDMNQIYQTNFIHGIFRENVTPSNFDKDKYIFDKAKATIELIRAFYK